MTGKCENMLFTGEAWLTWSRNVNSQK